MGIHSNNEILANFIATGMLAIIRVFLKLIRFKRLELLEEYAVNIKLSIIISMLIGLIAYNFDLINEHSWRLYISTPAFNTEAVRKLLGTIIIVQGFETSRFLSLEYNTQTRVNTMRYAQIISGIIYVAFVGLAMVVFNQIKTVSETSIIDVSYAIAIVLT